jgi:hypothetical protein
MVPDAYLAEDVTQNVFVEGPVAEWAQTIFRQSGIPSCMT